jgi:hypothetical protein
MVKKLRMFLRILVFQDVTLCHLVSAVWHVNGAYCCHCNGSCGLVDRSCLLNHCDNLRTHKESSLVIIFAIQMTTFSYTCFWIMPVVVHIQTIFLHLCCLMSMWYSKCPTPGVGNGHLLAFLCCSHLTFQSLLVTYCTTSLTFNNCTLCPHCIHVFCIYLSTNSDFCPIQHKLTGFYNQDEKCLLCGTNLFFK